LRAAVEEFQAARKADSSPTINLASADGGFARLCRGEIAAVAASRVMTLRETDLCERSKIAVIDAPLALDAIVVVVNPHNTWITQISVSELRRAWSKVPNKVRSWNELNAKWPPLALKLYGPTARLGITTKYASLLGLPNIGALRSDAISTEVLALVADAVARDPNGLGVLDWATYTANKSRIRFVPVMSDIAVPAFRVGTPDESKGAMLIYELRLYMNARSVTDPELQQFVVYVVANSERLSAAFGLRPFPAVDYQQTLSRMMNMRVERGSR
jgi:phosphate transport system substrate-binding protein